MRLKNIFYLFIVVALAACNKTDSNPSSAVEVVLRASHSSTTRTSLGGEADGQHSINWSVGDEVKVWAKATDAQEYTIENKTFKFATYNPTYNNADFKATLGSAMPSDKQYDYYAVYPVPATTEGTTVTYSLPAEQSGEYNPALDVMYAKAKGGALIHRSSSENGIAYEEPSLAFGHLFHLLRIHIPEGKNNLDIPIKRLDITFPQGVVGDVELDVLTGELTWDEASAKNTISIVLDDNKLIDAGRGYVWVHVLPRELSGEISFVAYNEAGVVSNAITTNIDKVLAPQSITPIALTIPESPFAPVTYVEITETRNNLGEDWNTMTFTGYNYVVPFTGTTRAELAIEANADKRYMLAVCAEPSSLAGQSLAMVYDSPNTNFSDPVVLGSLSGSVYKVEKVVPYLLEEDFSSITSEQKKDGDNNYSSTTESAHSGEAINNLSGWSGARFWAKSGAIRLNSRFEDVTVKIFSYTLSFTSELFGRLDSTPLTKLKDGATVTVCVEFDAGAYNHKSSSLDIYTPYMSVATHTDSSNPIKGMAEGSYLSGMSLKTYENTRSAMVKNPVITAVASGYGDDAFGQTYQTYSTGGNVLGVTRTTRLCFFVSSDHQSGSIGNCETNVYLDNIRVSIAK